MVLTNSKGTTFDGTVAEFFALEAGTPTYRNPISESNPLFKRKEVIVETIYGERIVLPSIMAAWRMLRSIIPGDMPYRFRHWQAFYKQMQRGLANYMQYKFSLKKENAGDILDRD